MSSAKKSEGEAAALAANPGFVLYSLGRQARRAFADNLRTHGLQPAHYGVLLALSLRSAQTQQELSIQAGVDRSDMVDLIDTLEHDALVRRDRDPQDRRRNLVRLTEPGVAVLAQIGSLASEVNERFFAPLENEERDELLGLLDKLWKARRLGSDRADREGV